jgi:hypothetical protein
MDSSAAASSLKLVASSANSSREHLEGKSVKYLRFRDLAEVNACADELRAITAAWRAYKSPAGGRSAERPNNAADSGLSS